MESVEMFIYTNLFSGFFSILWFCLCLFVCSVSRFSLCFTLHYAPAFSLFSVRIRLLFSWKLDRDSLLFYLFFISIFSRFVIRFICVSWFASSPTLLSFFTVLVTFMFVPLRWSFAINWLNRWCISPSFSPILGWSFSLDLFFGQRFSKFLQQIPYISNQEPRKSPFSYVCYCSLIW